MPDLSEALSFTCGAELKNRIVLAPLTNLQSSAEGVLGKDEYRWLTMRAQGGFSLTMTCAASVQRCGVGFAGQLGAHDNRHIEGLSRLAAGIKAENSHAVVQLQHSGMRARPEYCDGVPLCPSDDEKTGSRAMTTAEVEGLRDDFIAAALRCKQAGFDGVEIHGAHGYLVCEFLSPKYNRRGDQYGGSADNRARLLMEILEGIRSACGPAFSVGVRLSPERFGLDTAEIRLLASQLLTDPRLDYLDMSLWDLEKQADHEAFAGQTLLEVFGLLPRNGVRLGVAGKLYSRAACDAAIDGGADFVLIGRGAVLHHDFPRRAVANPDFVAQSLPVSRSYLAQEGLGPVFQDYMASWDGFVAD